MELIGDVTGKNVVLVDDMVDTAGTLTKAANLMMERGALSVRAICTHALLSSDAYKKIEDSSLEELIVSDTIPAKKKSKKIKILSCAKIFAKIFEYEIPGGSDFEGMEYTSKVGIPNSGLNVEVGIKDYGNASYDDQWFVNFTFNSNKINKNTNFINDEAFERISMEDKKYDKVRRENLIVKSKAFSVKAGGF